MGWLATNDRFLKPSKSRVAFLIVGIAAFLFTEFGRFVCRPYVRRHGIEDFGLTDSIGNWGGIVVMVFLGCAALNATKKQSFRLAAFYSIGFIVYEFLQPILPKGVFDWNDVLGTAIGFLFSVILLVITWPLIEGLENSPDSSKRDGKDANVEKKPE